MINIIHRLRMAKGTNAKLRILHEESDNEDWKRFLSATYDSSINYYCSAPNDSTFTPEFESNEFHAVLDRLSSRDVTGNNARDLARYGSQEFGELFRLVLGGSLKAGVSITTINKAYPGLIETFDVMLANKDVKNIRYPLLASLKYDGVRVLAHVESHPTSDNRVTLYTRAGKTIPIRSLESQMAGQPGGWYDGELVEGDGLQAGRTKITGSVNKCLKGTATDIDGYSFAIFDWISEQEWKDKVCETPYITRMRFLLDHYKRTTNTQLAMQKQVFNDDTVSDMFALAMSHGYEGLILRSADDPYVWKRSDTLIKKKATFSHPLKCVGTTEGEGKYEGMIGALLCEGVKADPSGILQEIKVKVGSGLSDHDREQQPSCYVGKEVEVLYNDIVRAEGADHYSLFLPRFKRIVGDYNQ